MPEIKPARDYLSELYLDFVNNYLTVEKFAEHNGLSQEDAGAIIALARRVFEQPHPEA